MGGRALTKLRKKHEYLQIKKNKVLTSLPKLKIENEKITAQNSKLMEYRLKKKNAAGKANLALN